MHRASEVGELSMYPQFERLAHGAAREKKDKYRNLNVQNYVDSIMDFGLIINNREERYFDGHTSSNRLL